MSGYVDVSADRSRRTSPSRPHPAAVTAVLAYFDTSRLSNGGTETINLLIEKADHLAHG